MRLARATTVAMAAVLASCAQKSATNTHGAVPAASAARPNPCATGGGKIDDPLTARILPRIAGSFCVEPNEETHSYGLDAKLALDEGCSSVFGDDCAAVTKLALTRIATVRYVGGDDEAVLVTVSTHADKVHAYETFSLRALGGKDPALTTAPLALSLQHVTGHAGSDAAPILITSGPVGALGAGSAYVWAGKVVIELRYDAEHRHLDAAAASVAKTLSTLATAFAEAAPPPGTVPGAINALPDEHLLPLSARLVPMSTLGITRSGPLAIGEYSENGKRFRLAAYLTADEELAKATLEELRHQRGATPKTVGGERGVVLSLPDAPHSTYVFARTRSLLLGVGDEDFTLTGDGGSSGERLTTDDKIARLEKWLPPTTQK